MGSCTWPATLLARTSRTLWPARELGDVAHLLAMQWDNHESGTRSSRGLPIYAFVGQSRVPEKCALVSPQR